MAIPPSHSPASTSTSLRLTFEQSETERFRAEISQLQRELSDARSDMTNAILQSEEKEAQRAAAETALSEERRRRIRAEDEVKAERERRAAAEKEIDLQAELHDALLDDAHSAAERARRGHQYCRDELRFLRRLRHQLAALQRLSEKKNWDGGSAAIQLIMRALDRRGYSVRFGCDLESDDD